MRPVMMMITTCIHLNSNMHQHPQTVYYYTVLYTGIFYHFIGIHLACLLLCPALLGHCGRALLVSQRWGRRCRDAALLQFVYSLCQVCVQYVSWYVSWYRMCTVCVMVCVQFVSSVCHGMGTVCVMVCVQFVHSVYQVCDPGACTRLCMQEEVMF